MKIKRVFIAALSVLSGLFSFYSGTFGAFRFIFKSGFYIWATAYFAKR